MNAPTSRFTSPPGTYSPAQAHGSILIVEDDEQLLRIYRYVLEDAGYAVCCVSSGEEGWGQFCIGHFDLLITDHDMPGLTGLELIRRIRPQAPQLPIMMVSGSMPSDAPDFIELLTPGVPIEKPFSNRQLIQAVALLLQNLEVNVALSRSPLCHA